MNLKEIAWNVDGEFVENFISDLWPISRCIRFIMLSAVLFNLQDYMEEHYVYIS